MSAVLAIIAATAGWMVLGLSTAGIVYTIAATLVFRRFFAGQSIAGSRDDAVTVLKPLHGAEPRLAENLATFLAQRHRGPIQLLCGVQRSDDPAIAVVESLEAPPGAMIDLIVDRTPHGANAKISNLVNMDRGSAHPILVLSDSDIAALPDYLARVLVALDTPMAGAVTCLYRGRGDAGFWSRLGAAGLSYQTLPGAVFGVATGLATPCMGSTIAMRRETLDRIGGFAAFADMLADDYAIGEAIRAIGLRVTAPPMLVTHASAESGFTELWRHELRWGATVRGLVPSAYAGSVIGIPLPLALLGALYWPATGLTLAFIALLVRIWLARTVDRQVGEPTAPHWLLPLRDCFTLAVFLASFFVRSVDWRGARLRMERRGRITADTEISA